MTKTTASQSLDEQIACVRKQMQLFPRSREEHVEILSKSAILATALLGGGSLLSLSKLYAEALLRLAEAPSAPSVPATPPPTFACSRCGDPTVFTPGSMYLCDSCRKATLEGRG